ncbi:MAG: hypothetical protein ACK5UZ_13355, partial [Pseudanabaena sp.]
SNQRAIAPPNTHKPDRLNSKIKQRSPPHPQNPIAYSLIKQRSPLITHTTRSPISPHQIAIAPYPEIFAQVCIDNVNTLCLRYDIWMYILY